MFCLHAYLENGSTSLGTNSLPRDKCPSRDLLHAIIQLQRAETTAPLMDDIWKLLRLLRMTSGALCCKPTAICSRPVTSNKVIGRYISHLQSVNRSVRLRSSCLLYAYPPAMNSLSFSDIVDLFKTEVYAALRPNKQGKNIHQQEAGRSILGSASFFPVQTIRDAQLIRSSYSFQLFPKCHGEMLRFARWHSTEFFHQK